MQNLARQRSRQPFLGAAAVAGCALTALVATVVAVPASAAPQDEQRKSTVAELNVTASEDGAGPVAVQAPVGRPLARPSAVASGASDVSVARAHLEDLAPLWGVEASSLRATGSTDVLGQPVVRFAQLVDGVPVYGAEFVVSLQQDGDLLSAAAATAPETDLTFTVTGSKAREVARATASDELKLPERVLTAGAARKLAYDPALLGDDGEGVRPVWRVVVTGPRGSGAKAEILVDARTARVVKVIGGNETLSRAICDAGSSSTAFNSDAAYLWCGTDSNGSPLSFPIRDTNNNGWIGTGDTLQAVEVPYTRIDSAVPSGNTDVNEGYDALGYTSDLFGAIGVDLTNLIGAPDDQIGAGGTDTRRLAGIVRYCEPPEAYYWRLPAGTSDPQSGGQYWADRYCPYENAYWADLDPDWMPLDGAFPGGQMFIGEGLAKSEDVIGHELAHGVTSATSGLVYSRQAGAINESMSDVFGQLTQLYKYPGTDPQWLVGDKLAGPTLAGAIRSMSNPATMALDEGYPQPDHMTSSWWDDDPGYEDNGGVHTNSGVGNKAAWLIAHGGTFRGVTVSKLAPSSATDSQAAVVKLAKLYWKAQNLLPSNANYRTLAYALDAACRQLAVSDSATFSVSDCANSVDRAIAATGMTAGTASALVNKTSVTSGYSVSITGRAGDARGGALGSVRVQLQQRVKGSTTWRSLGTATTASNGKKIWSIKPTRSSYYRVVYLGGGLWKAAASSQRYVALKPTITKSVKGSTIKYGKSFVVSGGVSPKLGGKTVYLQRQVSGKWRTVKSVKLTSTSRYSMKYKPTSKADLKHRVYLPGVSSYGSAYSSQFRITVK